MIPWALALICGRPEAGAGGGLQAPAGIPDLRSQAAQYGIEELGGLTMAAFEPWRQANGLGKFG